MAADEKLCDPWLVAVWPGMGGVAISAGYYLMAKLGMHMLIEFPAGDFFEIEHIEVKDGMILNRRLPRSRVLRWDFTQQKQNKKVFIP
jgi:proteasome assembly chaperone (PAC2) family protein